MRIVVVLVLLLLSAAPARAAPGYDWPLAPRPAVARPFADPQQRWQPGHRGVDLAAAAGQVVYAAGPGRVHHVGRVDDRTLVSVLHPNGLLTTYEPISEPAVRAGDEVAVGSPLGRVAPGHEESPGPGGPGPRGMPGARVPALGTATGLGPRRAVLQPAAAGRGRTRAAASRRARVNSRENLAQRLA